MTETLREDQSYFVLSSIANHRKNILSLAEMMVSSRKSISKHMNTSMEKAREYYATLQLEHEKLMEHIKETRLCLFEVGEEGLADFANGLSKQLAAFNLMTPDYSTFVNVLQNFAEQLPGKGTTNAAIIGRCMNAVRMGYYPTDLYNIELILKAIAFPDGITTNLFDPCCGEGTALKKLAVGNNCFTFGVELDEGRAETAQRALHRVGFGSFFYSRISHEAFHAVLLNPPYLSVLTEGGNKARDEKRFLIETLPHLMLGGLLIYIIPYYRLTPDICRILCDNLEDLTVHRTTDSEFKKFNQIIVMGKKIRRIDGSVLADSLADLAYCKNRLPCISEIEQSKYALPAKPKKVDIFKGAVFNKLELARQLRQSKSLDCLLASKALTQTVRQPPLPFTISQLGLVGGSGLINGLIECEYPHIIKGRIVKEINSNSTENRNRDGKLMSTVIKEKITNKMIFNILTPEGYKALA